MMDLLKNWINSNKYKSFQAKLKEKNSALFIIKNITLEEMKKKKNLFSKAELNDLLETVLQMHKQNYEARYENDLLEVYQEVNKYTKQEMFADLTKTLVNYYFYLVKYIATEDYELCAKLRDAITGENEHFKNLIQYHISFDQEDIQFVDEINDEIKVQFKLCL